MAARAGVGRAVLFHHDPVHVDGELDCMGQEAAALGTKRGVEVLVARDGLVVGL